MKSESIAVIILAAGMGTRMKSDKPKVMHPIAGHSMIAHLLKTVEKLNPEKVVVVIGPNMEDVKKQVAPYPTVEQKERLGTAHAVMQAREILDHFTGIILILYGDTPLLSFETLEILLKRRIRHLQPPPSIVLLGFTPKNPAEYGRLIIGGEGLKAIVEYKDASIEQRKIKLCNSGVMAIEGTKIWSLLERIDNKNAKNEYYLTDIISLARQDGLTCDYVTGSEEELLGINSREELAVAESVLQKRLRQIAMSQGATLIDPSSVYLSWDTQIGRDVMIEPNVYFGPGVVIGDNVEIRSYSHIVGAHIESGSVIGPFARIRPQSVIGKNSHIGNFVEIKNASLANNVKANHLSYLGDCSIGQKTNIGAGTITCNYDGYNKFRTIIGDEVFIGSNSSLIAPLTIGEGALIAAGSVISKDVVPHSLAIERSQQIDISNGAELFRISAHKKKHKEHNK
jgi:bifunctional UDP-N-acetylglucosamine pyrophosphorylase/glucosamine-1-phosphate N-acetyltransferase